MIPPNVALTLREDRLHLAPRAHGRERHLPGDILFRSLAAARADTGMGIVLSGYGRAEDRSAAREAGFDVHFVKPAELTELESLLAGES